MVRTSFRDAGDGEAGRRRFRAVGSGRMTVAAFTLGTVAARAGAAAPPPLLQRRRGESMMVGLVGTGRSRR